MSDLQSIENLIDQLEAERFFGYLHDFGAPVGYHLATRAPNRIRGLGGGRRFTTCESRWCR